MSDINLNCIEHFVTDWSGVFSDDRRPVYEANMEMFECRGIPRMTFEEWILITKASPREIMASVGVREHPDAIMNEYQERYGRIVRDGLRPTMYTGAKLFLEELASMALPVSVVSSHPTEHLVREAHEYGLAPYIRKFVGDAKEKAWEIIALTKETRVSPRLTAYLGDMTFDIQSARAAGVIAIGITTGYQSRTKLELAKPDFLVDSLSELGELVKTHTVSYS